MGLFITMTIFDNINGLFLQKTDISETFQCSSLDIDFPFLQKTSEDEQ